MRKVFSVRVVTSSGHFPRTQSPSEPRIGTFDLRLDPPTPTSPLPMKEPEDLQLLFPAAAPCPALIDSLRLALLGRPDLMKIQPNGSNLSPACQLQRAFRLEATQEAPPT